MRGVSDVSDSEVPAWDTHKLICVNNFFKFIDVDLDVDHLI